MASLVILWPYDKAGTFPCHYYSIAAGSIRMPLSHSLPLHLGVDFFMYIPYSSRIYKLLPLLQFWIPSTRRGNPALLACWVTTTSSSKHFVPCTNCTTIRGLPAADLAELCTVRLSSRSNTWGNATRKKKQKK